MHQSIRKLGHNPMAADINRLLRTDSLRQAADSRRELCLADKQIEEGDEERRRVLSAKLYRIKLPSEKEWLQCRRWF